MLGFIRCIFGRRAQAEHVFVLLVARVEPWIFQNTAFVTDVQQVAVHRIGLLGRDRHGNAVRLGVGDHFGAAWEFFAESFLPPWSDHFQFRCQGRGGQFESHLVVAFAGRPMRHGLRALGMRDLDHALGDERPRDACAEKVLSLVERSRTEHRKNEVAREFLLQVVDKTFGRPGAEGFGFETVEFLFLSDVRAESDHLRSVGFLQPLQQHRRVESARIRTNNLHAELSKSMPPPWQCRAAPKGACGRRAKTYIREA